MYKVIKDFRGSPDGSRVIDYKVGEILTEGTDFSADLAGVALGEGWVEVEKPAKKPATKKVARKKK